MHVRILSTKAETHAEELCYDGDLERGAVLRTRTSSIMQNPRRRSANIHQVIQWQRAVQSIIPSPFTRGLRVLSSPRCHTSNFSEKLNLVFGSIILLDSGTLCSLSSLPCERQF